MEENRKKSIRDWVLEFKEETGRDIQEIADGTGISRPALSQYLNGKYTGSNQNVEKALEEYLHRMYGFRVTESEGVQIAKRPGLFATADANEIVNICADCQRYAKIGVITGAPGFGKTFTLRYYARQKRVAYLECGGTMSCQNLVTAIRKALGIHCTVKSTYDQIVAIREFFNRNKGWLLIIDEADKMMSRASLKKMEALREIFDQSEVGLVLSGEPELANRVIMQLPRLASRVEISTELSGLSAREVESYFKGYEIDKDALELLKRRATNRHAGSFRVLDRTLNNLFRRMNESGETRITAALVEEAAQTTLL